MRLASQLRRVLSLAKVSAEEFRHACNAHLPDWQNVDGRPAEISHDIRNAMDDARLAPLEGAELF